MVLHRACAWALLLLLAGCATADRAPVPVKRDDTRVVVEPAPAISVEWRSVAHADDRATIESIDMRWQDGLAGVRPWRQPAVESEGGLLVPDAALGRVAPPPGRYRCRTVRLAPRTPGGAQAFRLWPCFVAEEEDLLTFAKAGGEDRPAGRLWPDGDRRMIFLGAAPRPPFSRPPAYGDNRATDRVAVLERVGDFRWRLAFPRPDGGLDVLELIPDVPPPAPPEPPRP